MSEEEVVIKVENVSKRFMLPHERAGSVKNLFTNPFNKNRRSIEVQHALKNISFEIKKGEFFGIVGRNGSGKSTLLKMLAGIYQPTSGSVSISGRLVPFIELGVGFNPELTGRENVYLNGALLGFSEKDVDDFYQEVVEFAELERFMDQKLKNYSSGMQVRLAFAMAIRAQADILLIDEVLAVGDADFQRKCFNYFKKLKKTHTTVIFVTHDMEAVREYCDRAMLIEQNVISSMGATDLVAQNYHKLFADKKYTSSDTENSRWGDGKLKTLTVEVDVDSKIINVTEVIKANENVEGCIVGIRIKDFAGAHLMGTNTKLEELKIGSLKKGETVEVKWEFPNIFNDGVFLIDSAVQHLDNISVFDWWDDAASFAVRKSKRLPYAVNPGYKVTAKKIV